MNHYGLTVGKYFVEFNHQFSESPHLPCTEISDGVVALVKSALVDVADEILSSARNHLIDRHQGEYNFNSTKGPFIENEVIGVVSEGAWEAASVQNSGFRFN